MKLQSAIEFLSVYGFVLLIIMIVIVVLFLIVAAPKSAVPAQCSAFGGPDCIGTYFFANQPGGYSILTVLLSDSQSVPMAINRVNGIVLGANVTGACNPTTIYPGQETVCKLVFNSTPSQYSTVIGTYFLYAADCNQNIQQAGYSCVESSNVVYSGSFRNTVEPSETAVFAVSAGVVDSSLENPAYELSPLNYFGNDVRFVQGGDWMSKTGGFAYSTAGTWEGVTYPGNVFLGMGVSLFPSQIPLLGNYNVNVRAPSTCGPAPFNSTFDTVSGVYYMRAAGTMDISIYTDDGMDVYYKPASSGTWVSAFGSSAWKSQFSTKYGPDAVSVTSPGLYQVTAAWFNDCAIGLEAMNLSGGTP